MIYTMHLPTRVYAQSTYTVSNDLSSRQVRENKVIFLQNGANKNNLTSVSIEDAYSTSQIVPIEKK